MKLTLLDIKGIKSERKTKPSKSWVEIERDIHKKLDKCCKNVIKLQCQSDTCVYDLYPDTWHIPSKCYNRICPICKLARQVRLVKKYSQYARLMKYPRFMTLTWKDPQELIPENKKQMDTACQELFRELRNNGYRITKYIKAMELKKVDNRLFRFHYHIIYDGSFIPQDLLSEKWKKHSKGSFIVDIRKVYDPNHAVYYLSKYISKSVDYDITIGQYAKIRKMRFFNSYGFKGIVLKKEYFAKCQHCGARMRYSGEYPLNHRLGKCVFSKEDIIR